MVVSPFVRFALFAALWLFGWWCCVRWGDGLESRLYWIASLFFLIYWTLDRRKRVENIAPLRLVSPWQGVILRHLFLTRFSHPLPFAQQPGELSAWSVFNPGFRRLEGDMSANQLNFTGRTYDNDDDDDRQLRHRHLNDDAHHVDGEDLLHENGGYDEDAALQAALAASLHDHRRNAPKQGRNELCACGSGRKHKHCCGRNA